MAGGLYIGVEGPDDQNFFEKIVVPQFRRKYDFVKVWTHACMPKKRKEAFLAGIRRSGYDLIYVEDIDSNPCVTVKKRKVCGRLKSVGEGDIFVVRKEVESLYAAGIGPDYARKIKIFPPVSTERFGKEEFARLKPPRFPLLSDFKVDILENYAVGVAVRRNQSLAYFIRKYVE